MLDLSPKAALKIDFGGSGPVMAKRLKEEKPSQD